MRTKLLLLVQLFLVVQASAIPDDIVPEHSSDSSRNTAKLPTVLVATLFRNKAHVLPYYFTFLDALDYPKDRIALWFRSDHNEDRTDEIIAAWRQNASADYHSVDLNEVSGTNATTTTAQRRRTNETSPFDWPVERHRAIIAMKEEALAYAKRIWADYVFFLDADVLLTDALALRYLVALEEPLVAPMLLSDGLYSNFWAGMTPSYYYQRRPEYKEIYEHQKRGEFAVPMVHSAVLVHLRDERTDALSFEAERLRELGVPADVVAAIPQDDIIVLAVSANASGVEMLVSNARPFGYVMVPLDVEDTFEQDRRQLTNVKVMAINQLDRGIEVLEVLRPFVLRPIRDTLGMDNIVLINLKRRPERRLKMEHNFNEIGLEVELLQAVDGSLLTPERLVELGVEVMPAYADPFHKRPMTMGEIGCFLSHFWVWEEMKARGEQEVMVLEDDVLFDTYFKERVESLIAEARAIGGYDFIYLGRKRLQNQEEHYVHGAKNLVHPSYSYWTLGYIITQRGVEKLLAAKPMSNMLPIDEFLPIMFDQHVNSTWKEHFPERNLIAWSAVPLLIFPTHYTGETGYISDTEDSALLLQQLENGELAGDVNAELVEKKGKRENYEPGVRVEVDLEQESAVDDEQGTSDAGWNDEEEIFAKGPEALVADVLPADDLLANVPKNEL